MTASALQQMTEETVALLRQLVSTPSVSRDEKAAADLMESQMKQWGMMPKRVGNNLMLTGKYADGKPTLLLNAHIDTVKPVSTWTRDPFAPDIVDGRLYGLGANDCGGGLVSLLLVFCALCNEDLDYNLVYVASAEEEVSGAGGFALIAPQLPHIDVAIVGEPTGMQPAIAEKGLMVIDAVAHGKSGHAARNEGENAIYKAMDDIEWLRNHPFEKVSSLLGPVKATVTIVNAGTQHNVIPDECRFTIDVRTNEHYRNEELFQYLQSQMKSELKARSFRLSSSSIPTNHPLVRRCIAMGMKPFGSPTLSDQALMSFPSLKLGPGESCRSHSADEYIEIAEIRHSIETYLRLLQP